MAAVVGGRKIETVRELFPSFVDGVIRLDGPGGSQTPQSVLDAITGYLTTRNANTGGVFSHSRATEDLVEHARRRAARFLGAASDEEAGFGLNATALTFILSRAAARSLRPGDEIVVTVLDHDANVDPWRQAAAEGDVTVRTVGVAADTRLDMAALSAAIGPRTRIVAFPYAGNATGTAVNVAEVAGLAHRVGAIAWADATHWAPHAPIRAAELGVDVAVCSAYKFFGPHLGLFYARQEVAEAWQPYQLAHAAHGPLAARFEHGTLPFESLAGLIAALDYLDGVGWDAITAQETMLGQRFLSGLPAQFRLHGLPTMDGRTATFALTHPTRTPVEMAQALAAQGIAASAGRFHATAINDALGLPDGTLRVGLLHYNTTAEIDRILTALAHMT